MDNLNINNIKGETILLGCWLEAISFLCFFINVITSVTIFLNYFVKENLKSFHKH